MQHTPYTTQVLEALMAAQVGIGLLIFALLWFNGIGGSRPGGARGASDGRLRHDAYASLDRVASVLFVAALGLVVTAPSAPEFLRQLGAPMGPTAELTWLEIAAALGTAAALCVRRPVVIAWSLAVEAVLYRMPAWFPSSEGEVICANLIWIAVLGYLLRPARRPPDTVPDGTSELVPEGTSRHADGLASREDGSRDVHQDAWLFLWSTTAAVVVCIFVMIRRGGSGDEWAYTWQSIVFAHGRAYGGVPPCANALQNFYVFTWLGRSFSQYTPGWPLLMAPFSLVRMPWLAAPVMSGLLAVGMGRLSRRAVASMVALDVELPVTAIPLGGWIGGLTATLGTTYLLNAGSRYAHVAVMALFVWSVEALCRLLDDEPDGHGHDGRRRAKIVWGIALGATVALCGATRPSDGACLELIVGLVFLVALVRGRIGWAGFLATTLSLVVLGGFCLVLLRLQLGKWFTTGYSLNEIIHPWNIVRYDWPRAEEWKYGIPLVTGSYCWFPCSFAIGLVGLMGLRGVGGRIACCMGGVLPMLAYYCFIDMGSRGRDWGYGPRYTLIIVVPLALGTAAALAPLAAAARQRAIASTGDVPAAAGAMSSFGRKGGPWALAISAMLVGFFRIVPLIWPGIHAFVTSHGKVSLGIQREGIHHAVVFVGTDTSEWDILDATENLPLDLYPNQDVIIAIDRTPELTQCVKDTYPGRSYYRARRSALDISLTPY